jgi:hypothetical protein
MNSACHERYCRFFEGTPLNDCVLAPGYAAKARKKVISTQPSALFPPLVALFVALYFLIS